jgi:hypothetical protein
MQTSWRAAGHYGTAGALLLTFLFSGLWHGASWGFVIWGLLHGMYLAGSVFYKPWACRLANRMGFQNHPLRPVIQTVVTFHLVCLAWIFFRASSVADAWYVVTHLFSGVGDYVVAVVRNLDDLPRHKELWDPILLSKTLPPFLLLATSLVIMAVVSFMRGHIRIQQRPTWIRWPAYFLLICAIGLLSIYDDVGFVYFQF